MRYSASSSKELMNQYEGLPADLRIELDLINNGWFGWSAGLEYNPSSYEYEEIVGTLAVYNPFGNIEGHPDLGFETALRFILPLNLFNPYIGGYAGYKIVNSRTGMALDNMFAAMKRDFFGVSDFYVGLQGGITFIEILDFKYNFEFHNIKNPEYDSFTRSTFGIGMRIPIRRKVFKRKTVSQGAIITKNGDVVASSYDNLAGLTFLEFDEGVTSINGFENYNQLEKIKLSPSIKAIGPGAFRNCLNLQEVEFAEDTVSRLSVISVEAFANDSLIKTITIPSSVVMIEEGAFDGWTAGQAIILSWKAGDTTPRELPGLRDIAARIYYTDGNAVTKIDYRNPFEDSHNWNSFNKVRYSNDSVLYNGSYRNSIHLNGYYSAYDENSASKLTNRTLADLVKNASKMSFKVFGDGKKYMLYIRTSNFGYFGYEFTTKLDEVTEVTVPFKALKPRENSKINNFDEARNYISFAQIIPCEKEYTEVDAHIFDFEVKNDEAK